MYAKPAFGGPVQVLRYLGRYTHRVAISNHRLLAFDGQRVTFRWRDSAHGNKQRKMTVSAEEFIRRFLLHVLPRGFVRIRSFGFLANAHRAVFLPLCRQLFARSQLLPTSAQASQRATWLCPVCHGDMFLSETLTAAELRSLTHPCASIDTS